MDIGIEKEGDREKEREMYAGVFALRGRFISTQAANRKCAAYIS